MNKLVLYIICCFCLCKSYGQENLVPNGDFELYNSCPTIIGDFSCSEWFSPIVTTPDYYSICGASDCNVPINAFGYQNSQSGNAYAGLVLNADDGYREYIAVKLKKQLIPLKKYNLKMFVSSSDWAKYGSNNLGVLFCVDTANLYKELNLGGLELILSDSNIVFNDQIIFDTLNWIELSFDYLASGCEQYLLIGNFLPQSETIFGQNFGIGIDSYYYLDNIRLVEETITIDVPNVFTPNSDGVNDRFEVNGIRCKSLVIVNRWGNTVFGTTGIINWDGANQNEGVYFYKMEFGCSVTKTGFIQLIR